MARRKKDEKEDEGKARLLDYWSPPDDAGEPIGCVATTFEFDAHFFERQCLASFLNVQADPEDDLLSYVLEREEKLRNVSCAAVLVDQHKCTGKRCLRWDMLPARVPGGGILHAKISLLRWTKLVRVIVASANITRTGYCRNLEVFGVLNYKPGGEAPRSCLTEIVKFLRETGGYSQSEAQSQSPGLRRWNEFLDKVESETPLNWGSGDEQDLRKYLRRKNAVVKTVLLRPSGPDVFGQLSQLWREIGSKGAILGAVVSPFFDPPEAENLPAQRIWGLLCKKGEVAVCFCVTAEDLPEKLRINAPSSLKDSTPKGRKDLIMEFHRIGVDAPERKVHAKEMWLRDERFAMLVIGSSNFTSKGMGVAKQGNLEANLVYLVDRLQNVEGRDKLLDSLLDGEPIDLDGKIEWQPSRDEDEEGLAENVGLPKAFDSAVYHGKTATVEFTFAETPPPGWALKAEDNDETFFAEKAWQDMESPNPARLDWGNAQPPSGFSVTWNDSNGSAWWPVNVDSPESLPLPDELKNLDVIDILASARPLHKVVGEQVKRREEMKRRTSNGASVETDPHKRVDTSQFLLQRTRRVSLAFQRLRERLEKPMPTKESLNRLLRGWCGALAVADDIERKAQARMEARMEKCGISQEQAGVEKSVEKAFLLAELALELHRVKPQKPEEDERSLPPRDILKEIRKVIDELKGRIPWEALQKSAGFADLQRYVEVCFEEISK